MIKEYFKETKNYSEMEERGKIMGNKIEILTETIEEGLSKLGNSFIDNSDSFIPSWEERDIYMEWYELLYGVYREEVSKIKEAVDASNAN
ncbi:MAG: hypothetical protein FWH57_02435 [Oscillospiraceae bacterium]|nr:hypothetical protein [Oscillospiraceae bacterium]